MKVIKNNRKVTPVYNVRPATVEDIDTIYSLIYASVFELCKQHYSQEKLDSFIHSLPSKVLYYKWLTDRILIVCCDGKNIIGFGQLDPAESFLDAIYVHPEYTGNGVGTKIINYLEGVASSLKKHEIKINAPVNAIGFYEKCGFEQQGTFFITCKDGTKFDSVKFTKQLI